MSGPDERFYMRREHAVAVEATDCDETIEVIEHDELTTDHVVVVDIDSTLQPLLVHENDVDFVCAALNAAARQAKRCGV